MTFDWIGFCWMALPVIIFFGCAIYLGRKEF